MIMLFSTNAQRHIMDDYVFKKRTSDHNDEQLTQGTKILRLAVVLSSAIHTC